MVNNDNKGIQKAVILWLSGVRLEDIRELPGATQLIEQGAMVELESLPIVGAQNQHYQVLSGRDASAFGFFDTIMPRGYSVAVELDGRGATPPLLPDLLRNVGWNVQYEEVQTAELAACLERGIRSVAALPSCLIVKCVVGSQLNTQTFHEALRIAQEWVGEMGLLAVLSDTQPANVARFVNVNNFLAEVGVVERDEQSGQVNWPNSLAYFAGHGQLWVNLLGRDALGAVNPQGEYEEVRDTLIKVLPTKLRDHATGDPVIERVYRKEDLYAPEYQFCAPDLVALFKAGYAPSPRSIRIDFDETTFTTPGVGVTVTEGVHPAMVGGFLLATAPSLAHGVAISERASLTAVLPTLLHALGVESVDVEKTAIGELFAPTYLETHPIHSFAQMQELSEEDEELIINRLRDLGYV